jgi:hypothetical protein
VERPDPRQDAEAYVERQEHPALGHRRERDLGEREQGKGVHAGAEVEDEEADQDERRPEQEIEGQLHRRVFLGADARLAERPREEPLGSDLARRAPDADQEIHREDGDLVEEEEHEEVERDEDAEHPGHEREQERVELLVADADGPRREDAGEDDDRRQQDHQHRHAVGAQLDRDAEGADERVLLAELEPAGRRVVGQVEVDGQGEGHGGRPDRDQPHAEGAGPAQEHDEAGGDERGRRDEREHGAAVHAQRRQRTRTRSRPAVTP